MAEVIAWRRFVGPDGAVELARRGPVVFERRRPAPAAAVETPEGRDGAGDAAARGRECEVGRGEVRRLGGEAAFDGEVAVRGLGSEAAAVKVLEGRVRGLLQAGHVEGEAVMGPAPATSQASAEDVARERASAAAREAFAEGLPRFVEAWRALGFDPLLTFARQGGRTRTPPHEVAQVCLGVAARVFGVGFTRWTLAFDEEHGTRQRIPDRLLADCYVGPLRVLTIAAYKLRGKGRYDDDVEVPGLEDEIEGQLRGLLAGDEGSSPAG